MVMVMNDDSDDDEYNDDGNCDDDEYNDDE